jgi:hypothetical protein
MKTSLVLRGNGHFKNNCLSMIGEFILKLKIVSLILHLDNNWISDRKNQYKIILFKKEVNLR